MSYKTDLQSNNVDLQSILNTINSLPEAGSGGGGIETCTVTIKNTDTIVPLYIDWIYAAVVTNGVIMKYSAEYISLLNGGTFIIENCVKNSIVVFQALDGSASTYENATLLNDTYGQFVSFVGADGTDVVLGIEEA